MNEMTDSELKLAIEDILHADPYIDSIGIEVKAELGFININGYVQSKEQSELVEKVIREFEGVKDVFNYLTIRPRGIVGDANIPHNVM